MELLDECNDCMVVSMSSIVVVVVDNFNQDTCKNLQSVHGMNLTTHRCNECH